MSAAATDGRVARPLAGLAAALVSGTALVIHSGSQPEALAGLAVLGTTLAVAARFRGRIAFIGGLLLACALGGWRGDAAVQAWERLPVRWFDGETVGLEGIVAAPPAATETGSRLTLDVERLAPQPDRWVPMHGRVRLYSTAAPRLGPGDLVRVEAALDRGATAGNPGQFSRRQHLRTEGLAAGGELVGAPALLASGAGAPLARLAARLRARLCGSLHRHMPGPGAAEYANLLSAMAFGMYAAPVPAALEDSFRHAGVVHVLVASGTQVSLLLGVLFLLSRVVALPGTLWLFAAGGVVSLYTLITGAEASIVRAAVMGLLVFGALAYGRSHDLPTSLAVAGALVALVRPFQLQDIGCQLAFAASAGIIWLGLPLHQRWRGLLGDTVAATVACTLGAQLAVAPLLVYHFRAISPVGLLANLPVIPVSGLLVVLGLTASLLGSIPPLAVAICWLARGVMNWFVATVGAFSRFPGASLEPFVLSPAQLAGWVLLLGVVAMNVSPAQPRPRWSRERLSLLLLGLATCYSVWTAWRVSTAEATVTFLDVGQGDSILVRSATGRCLLIDGGPVSEAGGRRVDAGAERVVPALMLAGVRRLDVVLGTHRHADHVGGLAAVVKAFPVDRLLLPEVPAEVPAVQALTEAAKARGVRPELVSRGAVLDLGAGLRAYVLWPPVPPVSSRSVENDNAVVVKLVHGQVSFLLASDLEQTGETLLARHGGELSATVLKVPHQGARGSCGEELLERARPRYAVISCGRNQYGHPAPETIRRLTSRGVMLHRTDLHGMVTYHSNGRGVRVVTYGRR